MKNSEEIELKGDSRGATDALNETAKAADGLDKNLDKVDKSAGKTTKSAGKMSETMAGNAQVLAFVAAAAAIVVARYAEVDAALGRLNASVSAAGGTQAEYTALVDASSAAARRWGVDTLESAKAQDILVNASGDATTALKDYKLAIDIAAGAGLTVEAAATRIAQARRGEVETLKDLRGFNKELTQDLTAITDQTERSQLAVDLLSASYDGAAEETDGLATSLDAMKAQLLDTATNSGDVVAAVGQMGTEFLQVFGIIDEGAGTLEQFSVGLKNFASQIREVTDFIEVIPGALERWGKEENKLTDAFVAAVGERDKARALEAVKTKESADTSREASIDTVQAEIKAVAEESKALKQRGAQRKAAAAARKRAEQDAARELAAAQKEAEERAFREQLARLKLQGEARKALELELAAGNATDSERELALGQFDAQIYALEAERALREEIAQLRLAEDEFGARRLEILSAELTASEELLALKQLEGEISAAAGAKEIKSRQEQIALANAYGQAIKAAAVGILEAAGLSEGAKRAGAAIDAAIAGYNAVMAFASYNIPSGVQYTVAAGMAAQVALSSSPAIPSTAPAAPQPSASPLVERTDQVRGNVGVESGARVINQNLYVSTQSWVAPDDARRGLDAELREQDARIGGGR